jgi:hypothetical protein
MNYRNHCTAFPCSAQAGYSTGQNMLIDEGLAKTTF